MRKDSEDLNKLRLLKNEFSDALENGHIQKANEILGSIDSIFNNLSGKSFRENLSKEQQLKLAEFMNSGKEK
ncbi:MAG: hypothetical protein HFJ45_09465 [Clostridia bacterium]|nr:hypothetical protein [Clostridia bacterium]